MANQEKRIHLSFLRVISVRKLLFHVLSCRCQGGSPLEIKNICLKVNFRAYSPRNFEDRPHSGQNFRKSWFSFMNIPILFNWVPGHWLHVFYPRTHWICLNLGCVSEEANRPEKNLQHVKWIHLSLLVIGGKRGCWWDVNKNWQGAFGVTISLKNCMHWHDSDECGPNFITKCLCFAVQLIYNRKFSRLNLLLRTVGSRWGSLKQVVVFVISANWRTKKSIVYPGKTSKLAGSCYVTDLLVERYSERSQKGYQLSNMLQCTSTKPVLSYGGINMPCLAQISFSFSLCLL